MKSMDDILTNALTPSEEPEFRLNQSIIAQAKEDHSMKPNKIKKFTAIACSDRKSTRLNSSHWS